MKKAKTLEELQYKYKELRMQQSVRCYIYYFFGVMAYVHLAKVIYRIL